MSRSGTVYYASTALDELERAQSQLDAHIGSDTGGRCPTCGEEVPCAAREKAVMVGTAGFEPATPRL